MRTGLEGLRAWPHYETLADAWQGIVWSQEGFRAPPPRRVKQKVLLRHGIPDGVWVESGTHAGATTSFLAKRYKWVTSIEPSPTYYSLAKERFLGMNVTLVNSTSEEAFPEIVPNLPEKCSFWLDGHYSGGNTFLGHSHTPVESELRAIEANLTRFNELVILVDDVRCFTGEDRRFGEYPSLDFLVAFAQRIGAKWTIEHDVFVMERRAQ